MSRGSIEGAPRIVRELLDGAIEREGFRNYVALAEQFKRFGKGFTKSSVHRYARKLERFQAAAKYEAEMMSAFGETTRWLITWSRSYPRDAERLVARLQRQQSKFAKGRS